MIEMVIYLPENPTMTSQAKGINYKTRTVYTKNRILEQRRTYAMLIRQEMSLRGIKPPKFKGAVRLQILFTIETQDRKKWGKYKTTKPDCDNLAKTFTDVLGDISFFEVGDQQIVDLEVYKGWWSTPSVYFKIEEVDDDIFRIQR